MWIEIILNLFDLLGATPNNPMDPICLVEPKNMKIKSKVDYLKGSMEQYRIENWSALCKLAQGDGYLPN